MKQRNVERRGKKQPETFRIIGELFEPLIPGIIAAGICSGLAVLLSQLVPDYSTNRIWNVLYLLLSMISSSFMAYMTAWVGYSACQRFGGTAILGGMLGMITGLGEINELAACLGLYQGAESFSSVLSSGRGGVIAAILGAWILARIEKRIRQLLPDTLRVVLTPFLTVLLVSIPYILLVMPLTGLISTGICKGLEVLCMSESLAVRMITGYIGAALFLTIVMMGMQYGFIALYSMQLETLGYVTLFPTLAMAGAGQVGAGLALLLKARRLKNTKFSAVISGAILPGMMGIATPLLYGVTLPLGVPMITAGLGAGFGGAFIMAMQVASTGWGASGLLGIPLMTGGPNGAVHGIVCYLIGLCISCIVSFCITEIAVKDQLIQDYQQPV